MRDDLDFHIEFISEIERHPPLYDLTCPDYVNRHVTDKIWENISAKFDESVQTCKTKWKIIRSSYVRSIKAVAKNASKEYYLSKYLQFLNKFVQVRGILMPKIASEGDESNDTTSRVRINSYVSVDCDDDFNDAKPIEELNPLHSAVDFDDEFNDVKPTRDNLWRESSNRERTLAPSSFKKRTHFDEEVILEECSKRARSDDTPNPEPCEMFMLSMVPHMKSMTQKQQLTFQKGVIELIENIKYGLLSSSSIAN